MTTRKWGTETLVNTTVDGSQYVSSVAALANGGFVVTWDDYSGTDAVIRGQRYDAMGNPSGGEFIISAPIGETLDQNDPSVVGLAGGGFFAAWTDQDTGDHDVNGAIFNDSGAFVRVQNSEGTISDSIDVQVARLGAGAVTAWTNQTGDAYDINIRIFDAVGTPSSVITANSTTAGYQSSPAVAAATDGSRFAVVWNETGGSVISGRVFTAAGGDDVSQFTLATNAGALGVYDPEVVWLSPDEFVVCWRQFSNYLSTGNDLKAQVFHTTAGQNSIVAATGIFGVNSTL